MSFVGFSWLLAWAGCSFSNNLLQMREFNSPGVGYGCPGTLAARDCVQSSITAVGKGLRSPVPSNLGVLPCY